MSLKSLISQRKAKEKKRPTPITKEKRKEQIKKWCSFYRRNINVYIVHRLGIHLHPFQHLMVYLMGKSSVWFGICTRGLSKSFIVSLFAVATCMLKPYSEVIITASTIPQAQKMVKDKIESEIIKKLSPLLCYLYKEKLITINYSYNDTVRIDFTFNGSFILVAPATDAARGSRATLLIYEECRLLKKGIVDSVFEPMAHPRQAKFLAQEKYSKNSRWLEECQSIFITSAKYKSEWFWRTFKETVQEAYLNKKLVYTPFAADIYLAIEYGLKTKGDLSKARKTMAEPDFRMEILNEMVGEVEDCYFTLEMFRNNQILQKAFRPPTLMEFNTGVDLKNQAKKPNEKRILFVDLAWANTTGIQANDNTVIGCYSLFVTENRAYRNLDYMETKSGGDQETALRIHELFRDYEADYLVMDTRSGGEVFYNLLTRPIEHPVRAPSAWNSHGLTVTNEKDLHVVPDSKIQDLIERTIDPEAIPCIIPIVATADLNNAMWVDLRQRLISQDIRFLIDEDEWYAKAQESKKFLLASSEEKALMRLPYIQTVLLINEAINLTPTWNSGLVKLKEPRTGTKDRVVALAYANYIASKIENKYLKRAQVEAEDNIDDWQLVF